MAGTIKYEGDTTPRSLWFLREIGPGTPGHRTAVTLLLRGEFDVSALECVAETLRARHATAFRPAWLTETRDLADAQLPARLESADYEPFYGELCQLLRLHLYRRAARTRRSPSSWRTTSSLISRRLSPSLAS